MCEQGVAPYVAQSAPKVNFNVGRKNIMKIYLALLMMFACLTVYAQNVYSTSFSSPQENFRFEITSTDLAATPSWTTDNENPPLASRQAVQIARATLLQLMSEKVKWDLASIRLRPSDIKDKWFYEVEFSEPAHPLSIAHPLGGISVYVLMNGKPATVYRARKE